MAQEEIDSHRKAVIVGCGPAGLAAAIYCARAGLEPLVVEGSLPGGQLTESALVENYPGAENPLPGMALVESMRRQAEKAGAEFAMDEIQRVDFSGRVKKLYGLASEYAADAVVIATGASPRWTGLPGEKEYRRRGVGSCAVCDGAFFKGKDVAVIGGGDTALSEALYLSGICRKVYLIHRRDRFRGAKTLADRVLSSENIETVLNSTVAAFEGDGKKLGSILLSGGRRIDVSGAFVAIGHEPQTAFLKGALELDGAGYVVVDGRRRTSAEGVFAAGDCSDPHYKQAVVAAGAGAAAAIEIERYLNER